MGYSVIVALTDLLIGYSVIVALTGLPMGYSVIVALTDLLNRIQCNSSSNRSDRDINYVIQVDKTNGVDNRGIVRITSNS